jgi:hypothetical protein
MHADVSDTPVYPEELEAAIRSTLAKLAAVDVEYNARRVALHQRSLSQGQRLRLCAQLYDRHKKDREPLVLHLANLHYRMMRATLFGSLAYPVPSVSAMRGFPV